VEKVLSHKIGDKAIVEVETLLRSLGIDLALGVGGYPREKNH
jgi:hypothetical protein